MANLIKLLKSMFVLCFSMLFANIAYADASKDFSILRDDCVVVYVDVGIDCQSIEYTNIDSLKNFCLELRDCYVEKYKHVICCSSVRTNSVVIGYTDCPIEVGWQNKRCLYYNYRKV